VNSIGDQGPPNFCLHRVARMLRPALSVAYYNNHCLENDQQRGTVFQIIN